MNLKKISPLLSSPGTVLKAMIWVNVFMFIISLLLSGNRTAFSINPLHFMTPGTNALIFLGATGKMAIGGYWKWWSLISANWLHGGLLHLLFNMLALRTLVPLVSMEFGISRMFTLYTLTGAAGFFFSILGNVSLTIGASSGICGLIGACFYFGRSRGGDWGQLVYRQTTGWVVSLALIGFLIPNINNWSHAGGLVSGIALGWLFGYNDKRKENIADRLFALGLAAVTLWLLFSAVAEGVTSVFF